MMDDTKEKVQAHLVEAGGLILQLREMYHWKTCSCRGEIGYEDTLCEQARIFLSHAPIDRARPFLGFMAAMYQAMLHHSERTGDPMDPWNKFSGPILRKALIHEYREWEATIINGREEAKELVDIANTAFFVWRFLMERGES